MFLGFFVFEMVSLIKVHETLGGSVIDRSLRVVGDSKNWNVGHCCRHGVEKNVQVAQLNFLKLMVIALVLAGKMLIEKSVQYRIKNSKNQSRQTKYAKTFGKQEIEDVENAKVVDNKTRRSRVYMQSAKVLDRIVLMWSMKILLLTDHE